MKPVTTWLCANALHLNSRSKLDSAIAFFIYEAPKVILLLTGIVFFIGIVRSFFSPERTRDRLAGKREFTGNILAALLGVPTPFCSCSAVPLFMGFLQAGVPLGVTLSFLIAAPMVNEVALVMLLGLFGIKIAALYMFTGLIIAIISGWIIGRFKMERYVEEWVYEMQAAQTRMPDVKPSWAERVEAGREAVKEIVGKVWPYILAGIAVGSAIHGYVPDGALARILGAGAWWSVPLAVLIGVPMYSNAGAIMPVVMALLEKGAAMGTALAFMMAVIALSLPEMVILRKVMKLRLIALFACVVAVGIIIVGYIFNAGLVYSI